MPTIKVPPVLRPQTDGEAEVSVEGGTVGDALRALAERYPSTRDQLFSPDGELNRYVNVYLNDEDVRVLDGLETGTTNSDIVVILPAMAGGCPRRRRPPLEVRARRPAAARAHYRRALSLNPRDVELLKLSGRAAQE